MIKRWRQAQEIANRAILTEFNFTVSDEKFHQVLDEKQTSLENILRDGLDIGGVIRYVVPVTLSEHSDHGWVFVRQNGEMFKVQGYL